MIRGAIHISGAELICDQKIDRGSRSHYVHSLHIKRCFNWLAGLDAYILLSLQIEYDVSLIVQTKKRIESAHIRDEVWISTRVVNNYGLSRTVHSKAK